MDSINAGRYSMGDDYLYGGRPKVAIETLTGLNVSTISRSKDKNIVVQDHVALLKGMNEDTLKPFMDNKDYTIIVSVDGADEKEKIWLTDLLSKGMMKTLYIWKIHTLMMMVVQNN